MPSPLPTQWPTVVEESVVTGAITFSGISLTAAEASAAVFRRAVVNIISISHVLIAPAHVTSLRFASAADGGSARLRRALGDGDEAVRVEYAITLSSTHVAAVHSAFEGFGTDEWDFALQYSTLTDAEKATFASVKTREVHNPTYAVVTDDDGGADWGPLEPLRKAGTAVLGALAAVAVVLLVGGTLCCVKCAAGSTKSPLRRDHSIENLDFGATYGGAGGKDGKKKRDPTVEMM